jgi:hypothetical protein
MEIFEKIVKVTRLCGKTTQQSDYQTVRMHRGKLKVLLERWRALQPHSAQNIVTSVSRSAGC